MEPFHREWKRRFFPASGPTAARRSWGRRAQSDLCWKSGVGRQPIWVFPNIGVVYPPKWMVYFMENPIKLDDLGVPLFLETPVCQSDDGWQYEGKGNERSWFFEIFHDTKNDISVLNRSCFESPKFHEQSMKHDSSLVEDEIQKMYIVVTMRTDDFWGRNWASMFILPVSFCFMVMQLFYILWYSMYIDSSMFFFNTCL